MIKKLKSPRIIVLALAFALLIGTIGFGASQLINMLSETETAAETTAETTVEPVVFRFNSQETIDALGTPAGLTPSLYHNDQEGKTGIECKVTAHDAYFWFLNSTIAGKTSIPTINLANYPYVVISSKWKSTDVAGGLEQLYFKSSDATITYLQFNSSNKNEWITTVVDVNALTFNRYDASGTSFADGAVTIGRANSWTGNVEQLRLDVANGLQTKTRTVAIEYVGFFPDQASALAYSGAMPNDEAANAIESALGNEMDAAYAQVNTQEAAEKYVQSKLSKTVADYCDANYSGLKNSVETEVTDYSVTESGGTIGVKATIYVGEVLLQTRREVDITFQVDAKPEPVKVVFDTEGKVNNTTFNHGDSTVTKFTKSFVANDGKKYMHLELESTGNIGDTNYRNFLQMAEATDTFSLDAYPYMKISYRRNVPSAMTNELMYFFVIPENATAYTQSAAFNLYKTDETPYWQEMIADMRGTTASLFTEVDGEVVETSTTFTNGITWEGNLNRTSTYKNIAMRFDFTRQGSAGTREIDIEYIAFFATEEEARNYSPALAEVETLKANSSVTWDNSVITKELAIAKAEEYINGFGFTTVSEIQEGAFTAPTAEANGSYIFDVVFTTGEEVTVTATIDKLIEPIVYTLDNTDMIGKFTIHPYSTLSLENGYMKMISKDEHKSVADSFYVEASYPSIGESFEVDDRTYFKARYRLSGISEASGAVPLQVFYWLNDGESETIYSRTITVNGAGTNGDMIELIMDMSIADKTTPAVWIKNVTEGGDYVAYPFTDLSGGVCTGTITKFRFNPARIANLKRDADVEYIGFFNKLEEAKAYSGAAEARLDEYQELLEGLELNLEWGNGNTKEKAIAGTKALIEQEIGCNITIQGYEAPTAEKKGLVTFSAEIVSGGVTRNVTGLKATIDVEPSPQVWRFNNLDWINSLTFNSNTKATLEDYAMKMEYENGNSGSEFQFIVDTPADASQFYLQNYPYIVVKYKRSGIGPVLINFTSDKYNGTFTNIGRYGFGTKEDVWYTSIVDTTVHDHENPLVWNFNYEDALLNWNYYLPINTEALEIDKFQGLSKNFTFTFKTLGQPQANTYIEYIGFFPTMEAALKYKESAEVEKLKANTKIALKGYTGTTVGSYYDGNTLPIAREKAKKMIEKQLGEKLAKDVTVSISDVSYTAPVANETDGQYKFRATISTKDGKMVLYTTAECTLTIKANLPAERVYLFTNPEFIEQIEGSEPTAKDYTSMKLSGPDPYFEYQLDETQNNINLSGYKRIVIGTVKATGPVKLTLNGTYEVETDTIDADGNVSFVFDTENDIANETIHTVRVDFGGEEAEVQYMGFFPDTDVNNQFDPTVLPTELSRLTDIAEGSCHYSDAKTEEEAENAAKKIILEKISAGVQVVDVDCVNYQASSTSTAGEFVCEVIVSYGDVTATYYKTVSVTSTIATMPDEPIQISFTQNMLSKLSFVNLNASIKDGALHTETKTATTEDAYFQFSLANAGIDSIYLPDYPYMSIKLKRTGYSGTNTGKSYVYFWNDEYTGAPFVRCPFGSVQDDGEWVVLTLDMREGSYNLFNTDTEEITNAKVDADSTLNGWVGNLTQLRVTTARNLTVARTADIEYIRFFPTAEMAEEYRGIYFDDFHSFGGYEYAKATEELTGAPLTFETAVRSTHRGSVMTLISNQQSEEDAKYFALKTTADGEVELTYCGKVVATTTGADMYSGEWKHITATVHDSQATIYLNGIKNVTSEMSEIQVSDVSLAAPTVGGDYAGESRFVGDMANMELYQVARDAADIKTGDYKIPKVPTTEEGMLACWSFDKCSDEGTYEDVSKEDGANALELVDTLKKSGHQFTGSDYITTEKELVAAPKTLETWVKISKEQLKGTYTLLSNQTTSSTNHFSVKLVNGQIVAVYNGVPVLTTTDLELIPGRWTHIALTLNDIATLYIDGVSKCVGSTAVTASGISLEKVYIGASPAGNDSQFKGHMADVRIWSTPRSAEEIAEMRASYPTEADEGLLSAWRLDKQKYLAYEDISANNNTATLYSDGWYKLENIEYDYTMIHYADTQNLIGYNQEDIYYETMKWISDNADKMQIKYLSHLGDVTQNNTVKEWENAKKGFDIIQGKVPYNIALGNHDYPSPSHGVGAEFRDETNFKTYFSYEWYMAGYLEAAMGGAFEENNPVNVYKCITVGDIEYIMFALEFGPRDEVLEWVSEVLEKYPNKKAIISTHAYYTRDGELTTFEAQKYGGYFKDANEGIDIWNKLVRKHNNVVLVNCGHSMGTQSQQHVSQNKFGGNVVQIMADPSSISSFPDDNGLLMIFAFTNEGTMHTYYYSPYKDMYYGTVNECTYDMSEALGITAK